MTTTTVPRLRLRPPTPADGPAVRAWLPEAIAAVQGRGATIDPTLTLDALPALCAARYGAGALWLGELNDGEPVGVLSCRTGAGALIIDALAVRADRRNLGYGQEMVYAAEATAGARAAYAGVPRTNGLAVYYWLRTGYHPLYPTPSTLPAGLDGERLWLWRRLT